MRPKMTEKNKRTILTVFGSVLGAFTFVVGGLLVWQVTAIYFAHKNESVVFTSELVAAGLSRISPALWIWLALLVVGVGLGIAFETAERKNKPDIRYTFALLKKRIPDGRNKESYDGYSEDMRLVRNQKNIFTVLWSCCAAFALAGTVYAVVYLCTPSHFSKTDVTHEMITMVLHFIPWVSWTFIFACVIGLCERFSVRKQLPAVKRLAKGNKPHKPYTVSEKISAYLSEKAQKSKFFGVLNAAFDYRLWIARGALGCVAVAFVIAGCINGGANDVLHKAIRICSECIGLG